MIQRIIEFSAKNKFVVFLFVAAHQKGSAANAASPAFRPSP